MRHAQVLLPLSAGLALAVMHRSDAAQPGEKLWEFQTGGQVLSTPGIGADGTVYVGSLDRKVYALNGVTGQKRWEFMTEGEVRASPVIVVGDAVYIVSDRFWGWGDSGGRLYALDSATGQKRWEVARGGGSPAVGPAGEIYLVKVVFGHDAGDLLDHLRCTVRALNAGTGQDLWHWESWKKQALLGDDLDISPVVGPDGAVYVASPDGWLYRLQGSTGLLIWQSEGFSYGDSKAAAVAADRLVVACGAGGVRAVKAGTGEQLWYGSMGDSPTSPPAIAADGTIYVGTHDGKVVALKGSGALAPGCWSKFRGDAGNTGRAELSTGPPRIIIQPSGLTVPVGGVFSLTVVAAGNPPPTYRWHLRGEPIVGATRAAYEISQAQATDGGDYQVVVSNPVGSVTSVVARVVVGYQVQVEVRPGGTVQVQPSQSVYEPGEVVQLTAVPEADRVFLRWEGDAQGAANPLTLTMDGHKSVIAVFSAKAGDLAWRFVAEGGVYSCPAIGGDGTLYFGTGYEIVAVERGRGEKRWGFATEGFVQSSPAIGADGTVYQAQSSIGGFWPDLFAVFHLCALDGATGRQVWYQSRLRVGPTSSPAIGSDGTLYVGASDGLYAFIATSVGGLARSPWPKFRGDAQNTGRVSFPTPLSLRVSRQGEQVRIEWAPPAVLQSSEALAPAHWQDLREAASPYDVEPAAAQRFYRTRRPRRVGRGQTRTGVPIGSCMLIHNDGRTTQRNRGGTPVCSL